MHRGKEKGEAQNVIKWSFIVIQFCNLVFSNSGIFQSTNLLLVSQSLPLFRSIVILKSSVFLPYQA